MPDATKDDTPPRWLDAVELDAWIRFAPMLFRLPLEMDRQLQRDSDLSLIEYLVLSGLSEADGRSLRMSTLATWTGAQAPRLSQLATRMESRGWLVRQPDPTDGRSTLATLTDAGYDKLAAAAPAHVANVRRLVIDQLTRSQVIQLGAIAGRVLRAISPDEPIPPRTLR